MTKYDDKAEAAIAKLDSRYVKGDKKVTSFGATPSDDNIPSEKLVKDTLDTKADTSSVPTKTSDLTNDSGFLTSHQDISGKANTVDLATVATSGDYNDLTNLPAITFERQQVPDNDNLATYALKINGSVVGDKVNVLKDFLLQNVTINEVTVADTPVQGYNVGDYYFDFVFNTKDNSVTDTHQYLIANGLKDVYHGDNSTIEVLNNIISVKAGSIGATQLDTATNTKLGYADDWNNSPAKNITAQNITDWNSKSNLTISDVDTEIDAYYDAFINAL